MADEKYYKVSESDIIAIADAIREKLESTKKFELKDFASSIRALKVYPSRIVNVAAAITPPTCKTTATTEMVEVESRIVNVAAAITPPTCKTTATTEMVEGE